jgi:DNA polymerase I-like protein with 3'-5' exonuclease and polymerase domains
MIVFDTESDDLLEGATKLHVINLFDRETGELESYHDDPNITPRTGSLQDGVDRLASGAASGRVVAGHNVVRHDLPLIRKLYPDFPHIHMDQVLDTLVVSRLIWTDLKDIDQRAMKKGKRPKEFKEKRLMGKHSLGAWGYRLGEYKGEFPGPWDTFTQEMADYGVQDIPVTLKLVEHIEAQNYSEAAIRLEHRVAEIIFLQEQFGFYLYRDKAERLAVELQAEVAKLEDELREAFQPWFEPERKYGQKVIMDPKVRRSVKVESEDGDEWRSEYEPGAPYCKVKVVTFEPSSRDKIASRLKAHYGWQPLEFTPTGKPEVNENTLDGLDYPEVKLLIRYLAVNKLLGTVATGKKAWLRRVSTDSRIHSPVNSNGAVTGRMTHADHIAQVPRIKKGDDGKPLMGFAGRYGYESRALFGAPPGKKLVGVDADGLELRMLGHYMARFDDGAYARAVVDGDKKKGTDAHSLNMKAVKLRTRDGAKTWIYAYLYGAGDLKLGKTFYEDMSDGWREQFSNEYAGNARERAWMRHGKKGRRRIEDGFPALDALQKGIKAKAKKKPPKLRSLDGRLLHIRAQHSALNTLLQGAGAVVMKKALVLAYDAFLERGWVHGREFAFVANVHDEFQMEVMPEYAEEVGAIASDAIRRAGEAFGLRVPLAGSAAIGQTWADTH